jgi:hypothetical protein
MFTGTKPVAELEATAPFMPSLDTEAARLEDVEVLTVTYEATAATKERVLPAGLHPPNPPIVTVQVIVCPDGSLGPFRLAQTRIGCRSGARPRAFLVSAVVDSEAAADALSSRWGYSCRLGVVRMDRFYDRVRARATLAGATVLDVEAIDPVTLRTSDIQWIANMNLAHTPRGLRLVQVDPEIEVKRAERLRPLLHAFDAAAWGEPLLEPTHPVVATMAVADLTLPRLRYICAPDQLAFFTTEILRT